MTWTTGDPMVYRQFYGGNVCPGCGRCRSCGSPPFYPYQVQPWPTWPQPTWGGQFEITCGEATPQTSESHFGTQGPT